MADLENGIFQQWVEEARKEVYEKGWRAASMNALLLLCHEMTRLRDRRLSIALKGPIRWFVGICASGVIWLIVRDVLNI